MADRISRSCVRCYILYVLLSLVDMTVTEQRTFVQFALKCVGAETSMFCDCHSPVEWQTYGTENLHQGLF